MFQLRFQLKRVFFPDTLYNLSMAAIKATTKVKISYQKECITLTWCWKKKGIFKNITDILYNWELGKVL